MARLVPWAGFTIYRDIVVGKREIRERSIDVDTCNRRLRQIQKWGEVLSQATTRKRMLLFYVIRYMK